MQQSMKKEKSHRGRKSVLLIIINFFKTIFKPREYTAAEEHAPAATAHAQKNGQHSFSSETRDLYTTIRTKNVPLIALSEYIDLVPENEIKVDLIINELRENNLKIIIPIYNARTILYPIRSQYSLICDVEYLLVNPEIIHDADKIRNFTDSLSGYKLKEDVITPKAILAIEKYLLTLQRQKKAHLLKKK